MRLKTASALLRSLEEAAFQPCEVAQIKAWRLSNFSAGKGEFAPLQGHSKHLPGEDLSYLKGLVGAPRDSLDWDGWPNRGMQGRDSAARPNVGGDSQPKAVGDSRLKEGGGLRRTVGEDSVRGSEGGLWADARPCCGGGRFSVWCCESGSVVCVRSALMNGLKGCHTSLPQFEFRYIVVANDKEANHYVCQDENALLVFLDQKTRTPSCFFDLFASWRGLLDASPEKLGCWKLGCWKLLRRSLEAVQARDARPEERLRLLHLVLCS